MDPIARWIRTTSIAATVLVATVCVMPERARTLESHRLRRIDEAREDGTELGCD